MPADPGSATSTQSDQDLDVADLEKLAAELAERGLCAELHARSGRLPYLLVRNRDVSVLRETVYVQGSAFWFSWAEKIADRDNPSQAADALVRVLGTSGSGH